MNEIELRKENEKLKEIIMEFHKYILEECIDLTEIVLNPKELCMEYHSIHFPYRDKDYYVELGITEEEMFEQIEREYAKRGGDN